jgi:hypothetical protein
MLSTAVGPVHMRSEPVELSTDTLPPAISTVSLATENRVNTTSTSHSQCIPSMVVLGGCGGLGATSCGRIKVLAAHHTTAHHTCSTIVTPRNSRSPPHPIRSCPPLPPVSLSIPTVYQPSRPGVPTPPSRMEYHSKLPARFPTT